MLLEATKADSEDSISLLPFTGAMTSWTVIDELAPTKSRIALACSGQIANSTVTAIVSR